MARRYLIITVFALFIPVLAYAQSPLYGVGISGGLNYPLFQDDQGAGSTFGFRGIVKAFPVVIIEPYLDFTKNGDPVIDISGVTNDLEGSKITSYGIDARIGAQPGASHLQPFVTIGVGFYNSTRSQTEVFGDNSTEFGWAAGLGVAVGISPELAIDIRGKFNVVPTEGSGSRKSLFITGGLNYFFGIK